MDFQIPEDLGQFSVTGLSDLSKQAETEYTSLLASVNKDSVSDEELDDLEALQTFYRVTVPGELKKRQERGSRFSALQTQPTDPEGDDDDDQGTTVPAAVTTTPPQTFSSGSEPVIEVKLTDIVDNAPPPNMPPKDSRPVYSTLVAAAGVPNYEAGQRLDTMLDVAKAFEARSFAHAAMRRPNGGQGVIQTYPVAQLVRDYPTEFSVNGDETDYAKLLEVGNEKRLPGARNWSRSRPSVTLWSRPRAGVHRRRPTTASVFRSRLTAWLTSLRSKPGAVASGTTPVSSSTPSSVAAPAPARPASST